MALGDLEVRGNTVLVGTLAVGGAIDLNGGAADAALVTNLNADQVDTAHKSIDGTLVSNSDAKVPTEQAVKTYADARKAECVALTGDQTVNGIKTLGSIPVLPASDPTTDNQATRKAYVDKTLIPAGFTAATGAEICFAADAEKATVEIVYTKLKEIALPFGGTVRVDLDLKRTVDGSGAYARIYKNDSAVGTERLNMTLSYVSYSEDIAVSRGDVLQLWAKVNVTVRNFRVLTSTPIAGTILAFLTGPVMN